MEEITEDSIVYTQQKESTPNSCEGCTFYKEEDCTATRKFYSRCTPCKTIWIKKEPQMKEHILEEIKWDDIIYSQQSSPSCMGCVFDDIEEGCLAAKRFYTPCVINKTIWIKKETEVSTESTKDYTNDKPAVKAGVKHDQEKERYDLVPALALEEVAKVLTAGAMKTMRITKKRTGVKYLMLLAATSVQHNGI